MRPLKLSMQAFGPYRERETIDFAELEANRVFLIHGDTGAGKTTILDAMVFALYGETSGGDRRGEQMRSELAPLTLATEVIFDFSLGARRFRIKRTPAQELQGTRRGGLVSKAAEVAMWERTGCGPTEEGRPLSTRIREVQELVASLLGLSCEQFRQVVILPQGRFRELLAAGSDKREEILTQLFRTERFRELEATLLERARVVRKDMERLTIRREAELQSAGVEDDGGLLRNLTIADQEIDEAAVDVETGNTEARKSAQALLEGQAADRALKAVEAARQAVETLEARAEDMEVRRNRLFAAARAEKVMPVVQKAEDAARRCTEMAAWTKHVETDLLQARGSEGKALEDLAREEHRRPERTLADGRLHALEALSAAVTAWQQAEEEEAAVRAVLEQSRVATEQRRVGLHDAEAWLRGLRERETAAAIARTRHEVVQSELSQVLRRRELLLRGREARMVVLTADQRAKDVEALALKAQSRHEEAKRELLRQEELWRLGRAAVLAAALVPGSPCPVCGSCDHPSPVSSSPGTLTDDDLDRVRVVVSDAGLEAEAARDDLAAARTAVAAARAAEHEISEQLARREQGPSTPVEPTTPTGGQLDEAIATADSLVHSLQRESEELEGVARIHDAEGVTEAEQVVAAAAEASAAAAKRVGHDEIELAKAQTRTAERLATIPADFRVRGALADALIAARATRASLEEGLERARRTYSEAREERAAIQASLEAAQSTLLRAEQEAASCSSTLDTVLADVGFADVDDCRRHVLAEADRRAAQDLLDAYRAELQLAKGRLDQAHAAADGYRSVPDLQALALAAAEAARRHEEALNRQSAARALAVRLVEVQERVANLDRESEEIRDTYRMVGILAEVANGQNASRVSFRRWVLGVYLDEVLSLASIRLQRMSRGRYRLERQREGLGMRRPAGLDLAVFDEFSGTARPAVTLSGGESFLAALALALGLAETVQGYSAGTHLETVFVDEGFGALDPDALELAVEALMELQLSGRLVGVISHVPELRQVIPARLEVRGGPEGSRTRFCVV